MPWASLTSVSTCVALVVPSCFLCLLSSCRRAFVVSSLRVFVVNLHVFVVQKLSLVPI